MVVAGLDHDEEVEGVCLKTGLPRDSGSLVKNLEARISDSPQRGAGTPASRSARRLLGLVVVKTCRERRHLHAGAAVADHARGFRLLQARQVLRQQRRPDAAEAIGTVTGGTILKVNVARQRERWQGQYQKSRILTPRSPRRRGSTPGPRPTGRRSPSSPARGYCRRRCRNRRRCRSGLIVRGRALRPAMMGWRVSLQIAENGRERTLPSVQSHHIVSGGRCRGCRCWRR